LTELIAGAVKALEEHGDIPVIVPDTGCGCCKSYIYDPAQAEVLKDVEAYDSTYLNVAKTPLAFVVS
jgi:hypothetical protein